MCYQLCNNDDDFMQFYTTISQLYDKMLNEINGMCVCKLILPRANTAYTKISSA